MLIANEYIAKRLSGHPTIYRIHEKPDEKKVEEIKEILVKYNRKIDHNNNINKLFQDMLDKLQTPEFHRVFDRLILRSMKRARYSVENSGHFGLAIYTYTHFTSPIRRLSDLIVHHQIKDMIKSQNRQFNEKELFNYAGIATERERIADESEREVELKNKINFMKKHLGEEFTGIIIGLRNGSIILELDKYPIIGIIDVSSLKDDYYEYLEDYKQLIGKRKGRIFKLTDRLKVQVSKVTDDIYLNVIE